MTVDEETRIAFTFVSHKHIQNRTMTTVKIPLGSGESAAVARHQERREEG